MKYWVTKTNTMQKNSNGDYAEIEVTRTSFDTFAQADAYVKQKNEEHHEYMLETHNRAELGVTYGALTEEGISKGQIRGIHIKDKRP